MKAIDAAMAMIGKYTGKWELFGFDALKEKIVLKSAWDDEISTGDVVEHSDRVSVAVKNVFTIGGQTFDLYFTEGYFIGENGNAGERFFEVNEKLTRMTELSEGTWTFVSRLSNEDCYSLGLLPTDVIAGNHVTVRVVSRETGVELEQVSRVTTVTFKNAKGEVETVQFVSLKGFHHREF
jgi:hypothetical protein